MKNKLLNGLVIGTAWLLLNSGCSHAPQVGAYSESASPAEEVAQLTEEMKQGEQAQVDILSPENYKEAQKSFEKAKKDLSNNEEIKVTLFQVAQTRAYLARANEASKVAHLNIEDVVTAREAALKVNANTIYKPEFETADHELREVTRDLERNKIKEAVKQRAELQTHYLDLELKAIKETTLKSSRDTVKLAIQEGANQYAPRSLVLAEKKIKDAEAAITADRHGMGMNQPVNQAIAESNHLLKITRNAKSGEKSSSEDHALYLEVEQNKVAARDDQLSKNENQMDSQSRQLSEEKRNSKKLMSENSDLEKKEAFNRSFDEARAEFTTDEAQVYQQGNTLMIRLRGLQFDSSRKGLKGSNFPLLAKVQKVIHDFGKSSVIVEGHTDSIGGKTANVKLSYERAQAVKDYFVANEGTDQFNITSIGYDFQKPISTNKTAKGRAQNRRVDVIIQAEEPAHL